MNFYIGQKVVCVKTHSEGRTVAGRIYTVVGFACCPACGLPCLDLNIPNSRGRRGTVCLCGGRVHDSRAVDGASRFRPLLGDEQEQLTAIEEEVKEEELIPA